MQPSTTMKHPLVAMVFIIILAACTSGNDDNKPSSQTKSVHSASPSEMVYVKYRGLVDLTPFECENVYRSSFIQRLCYDSSNEYALVELSGTYYHYCEISQKVIDDWKHAESMGRFYNEYVKSRNGDGPYDCRTHRVPQY